MIAWRYWALDSLTQPILLSPKWGQGWEPQQAVRAHCAGLPPCLFPPGLSCECGIHAYRFAPQIKSEMGKVQSGHRFFVAGKVSLTGEIIESETELRAEAAYPASLVFLDKSWLLPEAVSGVVDALAERYLVPVDAAPWDQFFSSASV